MLRVPISGTAVIDPLVPFPLKKFWLKFPKIFSVVLPIFNKPLKSPKKFERPPADV